MEELTESARQCLVSQGIIIGTLSVLNSLCIFLKGVVVITRANDLLHFTSLTYLAILEIGTFTHPPTHPFTHTDA